MKDFINSIELKHIELVETVFGRLIALGLGEVLMLALALGVDIISVSLGIGCSEPSGRKIRHISVVFGLIAGVLIAIGMLVAKMFTQFIYRIPFIIDIAGDTAKDSFQHNLHFAFSIIGAAVLFGLGIHMLYTWRQGKEFWLAKDTVTFSGFWGMVSLGVVVSIDAFSAGFGLGMVAGMRLFYTAIVVAIVNGAMAYTGLRLGKKMGTRFGRSLRPIGALLLIVVSIRIAFDVFMA